MKLARLASRCCTETRVKGENMSEEEFNIRPKHEGNIKVTIRRRLAAMNIAERHMMETLIKQVEERTGVQVFGGEYFSQPGAEGKVDKKTTGKFFTIPSGKT